MTRTLRDLIVSLRADHRAILLCTHDLDEAQRIADRVVILQRGAVVRTGTPSELRATGRPRYRIELRGSAEAALAAFAAAGVAPAREAGADGTLAFGFDVDDRGAAPPPLMRALLDAGLAVVSLVPQQLSLEDAYLAVVREARE